MIKLKTTAKNGLYYFAGTIVSAMIGIISGPLLTRILEPKVYAQYGIVISFTTLLSTFIYMGQDESFFRFYNNRGENYTAFLWRCIRLPITVYLIVSLVLLLFPDILTYFFESTIDKIVCIIICLYVLALIIQRFFLLTIRMEDNALNYAVSNIITKGGFILSAITLYYFLRHIPLSYLILCLLVGVSLALIINFVVIFRLNHNKKPYGTTFVSSKEMILFGLPLMVSYSLIFVVPFLEKILIRKMTNWETLAIYTASGMFVTAANLIKTTVNNVWVPYAYKNYNRENFKTIFFVSGITFTFFIVLCVSFVILLRRWLVLFFDKAYFDSMHIAPAMVCGASFDMLGSVYSIGINISKKTEFQIIFPIIQIACTALFLVLFLPSLGIKGAGISFLMSILISRGLQYYTSSVLYHIDIPNIKPICIMTLGITISIVSIFCSNYYFDLVVPTISVLFVLAISKNEITQFFCLLFDKRKRVLNSEDGST